MKKNIASGIARIALISFFILVPLMRWRIFFDSYLVKLWIVQLGCALLFIMFLYQYLYGKTTITVSRPVLVLLSVYLFINILSWYLIPIPHRYAAQLTLAAFVTYIVLCFLTAHYLNKNIYRDRAVIAWIGATVIVALIGMYHYYTGFRVISTLGNENFLASHLTLTIPVTLGFFWRYWRQKSSFIKQTFLLGLGLGILLLFFTVLYQTHSRGSWLGLSLALSIFAVFAGIKPGRRFIAAALIVITAGIISITPWGVQFAANQLRGGVRLPIWESTIFMITQKPWLGWGKGAFFIFYPQFRVTYYWLARTPTDLTTHAHNEYLQIFAETGIIGLVAFLILIYLVLKIAIRKINEINNPDQRYLLIGLMTGLLGLLIHNIVCNNLQMPSSSIFMWLTIGLIIGEANKNGKLFKHCKRSLVILLAMTGIIAIIMWKTVVQPGMAQYYFKKGIFSRQVGLWEEALNNYQRALKWYNWDAEMHYRLAYACIQTGKLDQAISEYERVMEIAPDYGYVYRNLGVVMLEKQEWQQSVVYFLQSLRINPYDEATLHNLIQLRKKSIIENTKKETST